MTQVRSDILPSLEEHGLDRSLPVVVRNQVISRSSLCILNHLYRALEGMHTMCKAQSPPSEKTCFDVGVLNPLAPSNTTPTPSACYRRHEKEKQSAYEQRIREIEHASFTPIVLSTTGGMGPIATTFYKRLADRLASKWNSSYSQTIGWLRSRLSFSLLRYASEELVHQRGVYPAVSLSL